MKNFLLLFLVSVISTFASDKETIPFDKMMGKESPFEEYIKTPEDFQRLDFYQGLFNKNFSLIKEKSSPKNHIPKLIHFVWLGPNSFPNQSIERLQKWKEHHPSWTFKFWTDLDRTPPMQGMEKCLVENFHFLFLSKPFFDSTNFGEKAKILAYELLFKEGGVYVDHDVLPLAPFDCFHDHLDFYCGLEKPGPSLMSSSVIPSTHLMGAKPSHPVIKEAILWLNAHWDLLESYYPGETKLAQTNRIMHRTFWALSEGIDRGINREGNQDLVFPTPFFNDQKKHSNSYALHDHAGKWTEFPSHFEQKIEKHFDRMIEEDHQLINMIFFFSVMSFLGSLLFFSYARMKIKGQKGQNEQT